MHLQTRLTEQLHIDQAVARARLFARLLNETLDELAEYGIHCAGVSPPANDFYSIAHDRRVELMLLFRAARPETSASR